MLYYVYILKCSDNSYYIGVTNNLERRVYEHNIGLVKGYTYNKRPLKLVYSQVFYSIKDAIAFKKQIKGWRREKKEALISNSIDKLKESAKSYKSYPSSGSG